MEKATSQDSIFRAIDTDEGPRMLPCPHAGGPWNPNHQHGGAVSGLLTRALDHIEAPSPMRLTRITVEMFRGVPMTPLRVETSVLRGGRRIQSVEARLIDGETLVARATGLRIRRSEDVGELEAAGQFEDSLGETPEKVPELRVRDGIDWIPPYVQAVDIAITPPATTGELAVVWTRLVCPFVEGETTRDIVRLAALVDFASGTGNVMDYSRFTSINPDLTIHVLREPRSDWIAIHGRTLRAADGIGQSAATVYDREGPVAQVQASLLLDRRPG